MKIELKNVGKRFRDNWVFRNLNYSFSINDNYVILGRNGSGKSTLLQIISGMTIPSEGEMVYSVSGEKLDPLKIYKDTTFVAPYVELFEQLTLNEMLEVHRGFKTFYNNMSNEEFIERIYLQDHKDKQIEVFSSGMKQRVKLALAIMSESKLLLMDEPLTNLDEKGKNWYLDTVNEFTSNRTIIVSSNHQKDEYAFCERAYHLNEEQ